MFKFGKSDSDADDMPKKKGKKGKKVNPFFKKGKASAQADALENK